MYNENGRRWMLCCGLWPWRSTIFSLFEHAVHHRYLPLYRSEQIDSNRRSATNSSTRVAYCESYRLIILFDWAETEIWFFRNLHFESQQNIDRHGPRQLANIWHLLDLPQFSRTLPVPVPTYKQCCGYGSGSSGSVNNFPSGPPILTIGMYKKSEES